MRTITYASFRRHLKSYLNKVNSQGPFVVSGSHGEDVVIISKADYQGMEETFYLLKSPNNAIRLLKITRMVLAEKGH